MRSALTRKIAPALRFFGRASRFEIEVPPEEDLEDVAREYESYGHEVQRDLPRRRLGVLFAPVAPFLR